MAVSANTILTDLLLRHQLQLQRVATSEANAMRAILRELSIELANKTIMIDPSSPTRTRYKTQRTAKLLSEAKQLIGEQFTRMLKTFSGRMEDLALIEGSFVLDSINTASGMSLALATTLPKASIRAIVKESYLRGGLLEEWFSRASQGYVMGFRQAIQNGMANGEGASEIAKRIIGKKREFPGDRSLYDEQLRKTEALTRSAVMHTSNEARMSALRENSDLVNGYQWLATLDTRTCIACASLDGLEWDTDGNGIGNSVSFQEPPLHWGCRCTLTPVLKSWQELGIDLQEAPEGTRASMDGQVAASQTFEDWIGGKDSKFQRDYLGAGRYELWKDGKITFSDLITQKSRPLTIEELKQL